MEKRKKSLKEIAETIDRWTKLTLEDGSILYRCKCGNFSKTKTRYCPHCGKMMLEKRKPIMSRKDVEELASVGYLFQINDNEMSAGLLGKYDPFTDQVMFDWDALEDFLKFLDGKNIVKY